MEQHFSIKKTRYYELRTFIKNHLPTVRFKSNPFEINDELQIHLEMDVNDGNKLNELFNKWYDKDHPKNINNSFWSKIFNKIKTI